MFLWVTKYSTVPLVDQIASQVIAAIASGELCPGARLPSIRGLASRLKIHPNSVRAAYLHLEKHNWIELRAGSGAYVTRQGARNGLVALASSFVSAARALGAGENEVRHALEKALLCRRPDSVLVVEPEQELREILLSEIAPFVALPLAAASAVPTDALESRSVITALAARAISEDLSQVDTHSITWLHVNSAAALLKRHNRPNASALVTFVSRSPALLRIATAVLVGAGWDPGALVMQDARRRGWKRSLAPSEIVIADSITIHELPRTTVEPWHLRVIADTSLNELAERCRVQPECDTSRSVPSA